MEDLLNKDGDTIYNDCLIIRSKHMSDILDKANIDINNFIVEFVKKDNLNLIKKNTIEDINKNLDKRDSINLNYKFISKYGIRTSILDIEEKIDKYPNNNKYKAELILLCSLKKYIIRYVIESEEAVRENYKLKDSVLELIMTIHNVASNKPQNLYEEVLLLSFINLMKKEFELYNIKKMILKV